MQSSNGHNMLIMKGFFKSILGFIFPVRCVGCRAEGAALCRQCLAKIPRADTPTEDWIISVFSYRDPSIKKLLWQFKFEGRWSVIEDIGDALFDHLSEELAEAAIFENVRAPILVPIPITRKKLRERGYNQAAVIARELARKSDNAFTVATLLRKTRTTKAQHDIKGRAKRLHNLVGAYEAVRPALVAGRDIVIVDDITTTHATLIEARRALRAAGAKSVRAFTIAH